MKFVCYALIALTVGCSGEAPLCDGYPTTRWYDVSGYDVNAVERDGLNIDAPADYDTENLADAIATFEHCLLSIGSLPSEEAEAAWCPHGHWEFTPVHLECMEFKVVDDWHWSRDGRYQMLWDKADRYWCVYKDLSAEIECYYRVGVQNGFQVIMTPKSQLLGEPLLRTFTPCRQPFSSPHFVECADIFVSWGWGD